MTDGPPGRDGPAYCSNCGSALGDATNYCPQCGTKVRPTTPAGESSPDPESTSDDTDDEYRAFRRRVQDRLVEGWEVESDTGDSVVLVDRSFGSAGWHVLVAVFTVWWTMGVGNLLYAAYKYFVDTDRLVLRADGTTARGSDVDAAVPSGEDRLRERTGDPGSAGASFLLALFGLLIVTATWYDPSEVVIGLFFLLGAVYTFPPFRRRLADRHPVTTFGRTRSTDETVVRDPDVPCSVCFEPIEDGIRRTYTEEYAVAGVPLYTTEEGDNCYCRDCARGSAAGDVTLDGSSSDPTRSGTDELGADEDGADTAEDWSAFEPATDHD